MRFREWLNVVYQDRRTFGKMLSEVSRDDLSKIGTRVNKFTRGELSDEPFNDIFGDKFRVVIPIMDDKTREFMSFLSSQGMKNIDIAKGTGQVDVETDKGVKTREVRIGKFLAGRKSEWLDFWQKNRDGLTSSSDGVSVVISRHPIDIIRMSDHSEWSSCHGPSGSWWKCAIQEAKTGGAIAYVVRNRDLNKIKNLQAKDIFVDDDRDVEGVEPLERLRLRRFSDDEYEYLVPELRTYGIKNVDFYDTVKQWALSAQEDRLKDVNFSELKLRGGSYQDNDAGELWSKFLGKKFYGTKHSSDQQDVDKIEARLREIIEGHDYEYFAVRAGVEHAEGRNYIDYRGEVAFEFDLNDFSTLPSHSSRHLINEIRESLEISRIEEVGFQKHENKLWVQITFMDEEDDDTLEQVERFLDYIDGLDEDYEDYYSVVRHILMEEGYLNWPELELNHFKAGHDYKQGRPPEYYYYTDEVVIGSLKGMPVDLIAISATGDLYNVEQESTLARELNKVMRNDISFRLNVDETREIMSTMAYHHGEPMRTHGDIPVKFSVTADMEKLDEEFIKFIKDLDEKYPEMLETVKTWWREKLKNYHYEGDPNESPAVQHAVLVMKNWFKNNHIWPEMNISVRNVGGKNIYWLDNMNMPLDQAVEKVKEDLSTAKEYWNKMSLELIRFGDVYIKYDGGEPTFYWLDRKDQMQMTINQAMEKYKR